MDGKGLQAEIVALAGKYAESLPDRGRAYRSRSGVVLFPPTEMMGQPYHGNLFQPSYKEIVASPAWRRLLAELHPQRKRLPEPFCDSACDVDSCNSSKALLLSIFGWEAARADNRLCRLFSVDRLEVDFEFAANLAWTEGRMEVRSTKVDMRVLGRGRSAVHVEAKLTEEDFTSKPAVDVERYAALSALFDARRLLRNGQYEHYQLIRNVIAAVQHDCRLCLLYDARRDDLIAKWNAVLEAIRDQVVRARCFTMTWQSVARCSPEPLAAFLQSKYGIA